MKVIVVDDESRLAKMISDLLELEGVNCGWFDDSSIAYEEILKHKPAIVVSDIVMPLLDGLELMKKVNQSLGDIKFIFFSGQNPYSDDTLLNQGAQKVFQKPQDLQDVFSYVEEHLGFNNEA